MVNARSNGEPVSLRPKQLVFALGVSGYKNIPTFDGAGSLAWEQRHSRSTRAGDWTGKNTVVLGSNNS